MCCLFSVYVDGVLIINSVFKYDLCLCECECFMTVCLWFTSTAKAFLRGQKRFQAFIFPTEFTADLKKFSLEEKNRKKVISSRIHNETNLNSFKSTYSRALLRSLLLFALISFYLVWLGISTRARGKGIFRSHFSSLFSARSQRKRENGRERKISLAHTQRRFLYGTLFCSFFCVGVSVILFFYSYWLVWKIKLARSP